MNWDQANWDQGFWDSEAPKPKTKKTMKRPNWFPRVLGDQIVWLQNIHKLSGHAATLGLDLAVVTARLLDADNAEYALNSYRGGISSFPDAAFARIDEVLHGDNPDNIVWLTFAAPSGTPAAVPYGCLDRLLSYLTDVVQKSPDYTKSIGLDLRIENAPAPTPSVITSPDFTLRATGDGKMEVVWTKGTFDGVKLEFDLGSAGTRSDMDLRPNYTLNWLPPAGQSAIVKVRLRYIFKGNDFGNWSDWKNWTLTGA